MNSQWQAEAAEMPPINKLRGGFYGNGMVYMGVSKNRGAPKWMVYDGKPF